MPNFSNRINWTITFKGRSKTSLGTWRCLPQRNQGGNRSKSPQMWKETCSNSRLWTYKVKSGYMRVKRSAKRTKSSSYKENYGCKRRDFGRKKRNCSKRNEWQPGWTETYKTCGTLKTASRWSYRGVSHPELQWKSRCKRCVRDRTLIKSCSDLERVRLKAWTERTKLSKAPWTPCSIAWHRFSERMTNLR